MSIDPMATIAADACPREFSALEPRCHTWARDDGWLAGYLEGFTAGREVVWHDIDQAAAAAVDGARRSIDVQAARERRRWAS